MNLRRLGITILSIMLLLTSVVPAEASAKEKKASKKELEKHAVEFTTKNPSVYSDPTMLDQYTRERMMLLGMNPVPSITTDDEYSIMCGSFCYTITEVHSIWVNSKNVDQMAYPIWENTIVADWGSGGAAGTWSATWSTSTESTWSVSGSITAEAKYAFLAKIEAQVGGGYSRTTGTVWSGTTTMTYSVPEGQQQTLNAYEKGTYWTFNCDCTIQTSGGYSRVTISNASDGREAYPHQATTFVKGAILPIQ